MKKVLISLLSICTLTSCAQKNQKTSISMRNQHINYDNIVEETMKYIKHYDKEPQYFIRPIQTNCIFEILVNDYPAYKEYTLDKLASPKAINNKILRSGPQTVTVRMYPIGNLIKETYGSGEPVTTLQRNSNVSIKVVKYEAFNISDELEDEIVVLQHESPTDKKTGNFMGNGLPFYEYTFTFNAQVPYEMEGWSNGEDLTKFDKNELEQAVLKFYSNYQQLDKNKDLNEIVRLSYNYELRNAISLYRDKKYVKELWQEYKDPLYHKNKEYQPIENYKMKFYGNHRIVTLQFPTINPLDNRLRGESAFWFLYNNGNGLRANWTNVYLYIPKGGNLTDIQTIK